MSNCIDSYSVLLMSLDSQKKNSCVGTIGWLRNLIYRNLSSIDVPVLDNTVKKVLFSTVVPNNNDLIGVFRASIPPKPMMHIAYFSPISNKFIHPLFPQNLLISFYFRSICVNLHSLQFFTCLLF